MRHGLKHTRTIESGPDGRIRKGFSTDPSEIKVWKDTITRDDGEDAEVDMIRVPVSSTGTDRDGDHFSEDGLTHMVDQLKSGEVPIYGNHGLDESGWPAYRWEDALGGWKDGEIEDTDDGKVVYGIGALDPADERNEKLVEQIKNGAVPISWSVGFMPQNWDKRTDDNGDPVGRIFHEHDLFEVSRVGIPSNTDATIAATASAAAKGLAVAKGITSDEEIRTLATELEAEIKTGGSLAGPLEYMKDDKNTDPSEAGDGEEKDPEEIEEERDLEPEEQRENDDDDEEDDEEEESEGPDSDDDEEDDEDEEENDSLTLSGLRSLLTDELEPIHEELREVRELVTDSAEEEEREAAISELREKVAELEERNEELEERLSKPTDPKGRSGGRIVPAERDRGEEREANTAEAGTTRTKNADGDGLGALAEAIKEGN